MFLMVYWVAEAEEEFPEGNELEEVLMHDALAPADEFTCTPELGFLRPGGTFNDPSQTITQNPLECCRLCSEDPRCLTWSRKRSTGECFLMSVIPPLVPNEDFDSGLLASTDALDVIPEPDCLIEKNVFFPDGQILEETRTRNAKRCCERCLNNEQCFSWYHAKDTGICSLNRDVPEKIDHRGYKGAALI